MIKDLIYAGKIRHRRFTPKPHHFSYDLFMFFFDISKIEHAFKDMPEVTIEKFNWFSFRRKNYLVKPDVPLDQVARELIHDKFDVYPTGKIYLLTHLSCLNYCFNPMSLYLVFKEASDEIEYLIVEVTNTPWGERHFYLLANPLRPSKDIYQFRFKKELHVSPFMAMNYEYQFDLKVADNKIIVHMKNYHDDEVHFDATLSLSSELSPILKSERLFLRYPFMTQKVAAAIYWQAFKLWVKGIAFHPHPKTLKDKSHGK